MAVKKLPNQDFYYSIFLIFGVDMIAGLLVRVLGGVWGLKNFCNSTSNVYLKKISLYIYSAYQYENGSSVAWNSRFSGEPCFPHGMKSIFISGGAVVGKECVIFQQVTIGSNMLSDSKNVGSPIIGNSCYIGAGAKIVGPVVVGDNVRIGANSVVYKDVPSNSVVLSGEQKIIQKGGPLDNRFYTFRSGWKYFENGRWVEVSDPDVLARLRDAGKA